MGIVESPKGHTKFMKFNEVTLNFSRLRSLKMYYKGHNQLKKFKKIVDVP